jgi:hypothetical protein
MRLKRHKICVDDFDLLTIIGRGAFGEVRCMHLLYKFGWRLPFDDRQCYLLYFHCLETVNFDLHIPLSSPTVRSWLLHFEVEG